MAPVTRGSRTRLAGSDTGTSCHMSRQEGVEPRASYNSASFFLSEAPAVAPGSSIRAIDNQHQGGVTDVAVLLGIRADEIAEARALLSLLGDPLRHAFFRETAQRPTRCGDVARDLGVKDSGHRQPGSIAPDDRRFEVNA